MHRRFADSELFCSLPDSCVAVDDVVGDGDGPLLDVLLHELLPENVFYIIFPIDSSYDSGTIYFYKNALSRRVFLQFNYFWIGGK